MLIWNELLSIIKETNMKKCDSVKQIIEASSQLLNESENSECFDVTSLASTLKDECDILNKMFTDNPELVSELNQQKRKVENLALRLEFFLRVRHNAFEERNKLREFAEKLYTDTRQVTLELSKKENVDKVVLNEWGAKTKWALEFYARSKHILFEVDNEDEIEIRSITIALERVRNNG